MYFNSTTGTHFWSTKRREALYSKFDEKNIDELFASLNSSKFFDVNISSCTVDYLDYVPRIGNARFIWIIRIGAHPNNSWSAFEDNSPITPFVRFLNAVLCGIRSV